jgi:hypothetical protein
MKSYQPLHLALALLAGVAIPGVAAVGTAHANPRMGGAVYTPPPPRPVYSPPVYVPRPPTVDTRSMVPTNTRSVGPSAGTGSTSISTYGGTPTGGSSTFGPTGSPPKVPRTESQTMTMTGPDGNPIGTIGVTKNNVDIPDKMKQDVVAKEAIKYPSGT